MTALEPRKCLACEKPLKGRIDKRFCDDYCRNNYNNQQKSKSSHSAYVRGIMNTLIKNRKILEDLLPPEKQTINLLQEKLLQRGYIFKYFTHTYKNKAGEVYYYCFDYGFRLLENGWVMIVKRREEKEL
jgi:predicted nucleic acid-binding Zn ribbon protein